MSTPQRKGCRGTLTRFRNPAAAPGLRCLLKRLNRFGHRHSVNGAMEHSTDFGVEVSNSVEFCRMDAGLVSCPHTCVMHPFGMIQLKFRCDIFSLNKTA